jgi:hypothetical protein
MKNLQVKIWHLLVGVVVGVVVGGTGAVIARIVVVSRAVGTARGDLIRRAATAGSGAEASARVGRGVGGHLDSGL